MGLHRLTPVMTSAQRHNKANSRLLQVQLLGLPGGEQKTPKKRRHVVGGDSRVPPELLRGRQTCTSAAAQPYPCCSIPWGRGQRGLWGGTSTEGWGRRGTTPCASAPSSVSIRHKTQAKRAARSAETLSASASVVQGPCLAESLPAHPASNQSISQLVPGTLQEGSSGDQKAPRALLQKLFYSHLLLAALAAPSRTRPPPINQRDARPTPQLSIAQPRTRLSLCKTQNTSSERPGAAAEEMSPPGGTGGTQRLAACSRAAPAPARPRGQQPRGEQAKIAALRCCPPRDEW